MVSRRPKSDKCAYCGTRQAHPGKGDHVPPRSVFVKPRPSNMITVPACRPCNKGFSDIDEEFRVALSLLVGVNTPESKAFWRNHALPTIRHNQRINRAVLGRLREVDVRSEGGVLIGCAGVVPLSVATHNAFIERVVRGLFYHCYGEPLGPAVKFQIFAQGYNSQNVPELIRAYGKYCSAGSVGEIQFRYMYARADDAPLGTMWFLEFHGKHLVAAITESVVHGSLGPASTWPRPVP